MIQFCGQGRFKVFISHQMIKSKTTLYDNSQLRQALDIVHIADTICDEFMIE